MIKDKETGEYFESLYMSKFESLYMSKEKKTLIKTLNVDFDGTMCDAEFVNESTIVGEPIMTVYGFNSIQWLEWMCEGGIPVNIFSCRNYHAHGVSLMKSWLKHKGMKDTNIAKIGFPTVKPYGIHVDDNAIQSLKYGVCYPTIEEVRNFLR